MPRLIVPIESYKKGLTTWLFSSNPPSTLGTLIEMRGSRARQSTLSSATSSEYPYSSLYDTQTSNNASPAQDLSDAEPTISNWFKKRFLLAFGIDGFNPVTNKFACTDGSEPEYTSTSLPFRFVITALLGLPNRPEKVIDGVPQLSFRQFLRGLGGGWTTNTEVNGTEPKKHVFDLQNIDSLNMVQHEKKTRWTYKQITQIIAIPVKLLVILPIKIITIPFKVLLNAAKLVTEILLPLISIILAKLNILMGEAFAELALKAFANTSASDDAERLRERKFNKLKITGFVFFTLVWIPLIIATAVVQYATVWVCRAALALTSPAESARRAFASGRSVAFGGKLFANFLGLIGFLMSLTASAVLWTIALPFAFSAVTTLVPSTLAFVNWVAQLPFITTSLTWISQTGMVTGSMVLLNQLFASVGVALATAFGPAVTFLATAISVQVPAAVLAVGTTLGMLTIPAASVLSLIAEKLSNLWALWIESGPFTFLMSLRGSAATRGQSSYVPLQETTATTANSLTYNKDETLLMYVNQDTYRFDAQSGQATGTYIVSPIPLDLTGKNDHLLQVAGEVSYEAERIFNLAKNPDQQTHKYKKYRLPTQEELSANEIQKFNSERSERRK